MLTPAAKRRRRAEEATAVLKRPFRSPAVKTQDKRRVSTEAAASESSLSVASPERKHKQAVKPERVPATPKSMSELVARFEKELDAGDRALERAVIPEKPKEPENNAADELPELIGRWREAGRMAADEVFELVSERVARAGGVKAWRAMVRQAGSMGFQDWGETKQPREGDEAEGDDEAEREENDERESEPPEEDEEENFTMAMMLASINVDPDVLGYDEAEERWKDEHGV